MIILYTYYIVSYILAYYIILDILYGQSRKPGHCVQCPNILGNVRMTILIFNFSIHCPDIVRDCPGKVYPTRIQVGKNINFYCPHLCRMVFKRINNTTKLFLHILFVWYHDLRDTYLNVYCVRNKLDDGCR